MRRLVLNQWMQVAGGEVDLGGALLHLTQIDRVLECQPGDILRVD